MIATVRQLLALIGRERRGRWVLVVAMALVLSGLEAVATLLVFALLGALAGESADMSLPLLGDLREVLPWEGLELLAWLGAAVAVVYIARSAFLLAQHYVQYRVAENTGAQLSSKMLRGYLLMSYEFHLQRNSSELIRNAKDSVRKFVEDGLVPCVNLLSKGAILLGIVGALLLTDPFATGFAVVAISLISVVILRVVLPRVGRLGHLAKTMEQQNLQTLQQSLHGARDITVLGREPHFIDTYHTDRRQLARAQYLRRTAAQLPRLAIETGVVLLISTFVGFAVLVEGDATQALPMLGVFGYAAVRLMPELQAITGALNSLKYAGPPIADIHEDLRAFEQCGTKRLNSVDPLPFREDLVAEDVGYSYPNTTTPALTGVDVTIHPGQSIGVVGPTGGGKSTLVDLLLGLLPPTSGRILVDGADVQAHTRAWQANLGVVPQMVFLTDDTLRRNIALGVADAKIDEEALAEAVHLAQLEDVIADLPDGLDTIIGERGIRVSGGQRQRVAIARALYRRPSVLVFDEGTSALDTGTETAFMDALESLRGARTLITVAHRLSTVQHCDTVLLVRRGRIADRGTLDELATRHPELQTAGALS